jgi:hypothetical protein
MKMQNVHRLMPEMVRWTYSPIDLSQIQDLVVEGCIIFPTQGKVRRQSGGDHYRKSKGKERWR